MKCLLLIPAYNSIPTDQPLRVLLRSVYLASGGSIAQSGCETSSVVKKTMVDKRLQGKSHASKEEQKGAREPINGAVETSSIIRHSRLSDIRLRLEDVMWSHGG